jgi:probable phosphoglycerate mutase
VADGLGNDRVVNYPELYVLRHGETEWNRIGRMQGALDSPLTDLGRAQAARQGEILASAGVTAASHAFRVSPLGRAQATAEIALAAMGAVAEVDSRLAEISLGPCNGLTRDEIDRRFPDRHSDLHPFFWYDTVPGGEGFAGLEARIDAFLAGVTRPTVIVTHGMVSLFLRGRVLALGHDGMAELPGGQGVIYHLKDGVQTRLE